VNEYDREAKNIPRGKKVKVRGKERNILLLNKMKIINIESISEVIDPQRQPAAFFILLANC